MGLWRKLLEAKESRLQGAAARGDLAMVRALLEDNPGLVLNKGKNGRTPLHHSAASDRKEVAELLLESGGDANARDYDHRTALDLAADNRHHDVAALLRQHGGHG